MDRIEWITDEFMGYNAASFSKAPIPVIAYSIATASEEQLMGFVRLTLIASILVLIPIAASADWSTDPFANNPVCELAGDQSDPIVIDDGNGGSIIAWIDERAFPIQIYVQRLDTDGNLLWDPSGIQVSTVASSQEYPQMVSDGNGGAIILWEDEVTPPDRNIYAQRIDPLGNRLWSDSGKPVCTESGFLEGIRMIPDGEGGAIAVWADGRGSDYDIYAQRLDENGDRMWPTAGAPVCTSANSQLAPDLTGDNAGGVIIAWEDIRNGSEFRIYAQRLDPDGDALWDIDGKSVSDLALDQTLPQVVEDGSGGAFVAFERDYDLFGGTGDIYAQRLDGDGNRLWGMGIEPCNMTQVQYWPDLLYDGSGGAFLSWRDLRDDQPAIYTQHLNAVGNNLWNGEGIRVCNLVTSMAWHRYPDMVTDGEGGLIITWDDGRNGDSFYGSLYAQRLDPYGQYLWSAEGALVSIESGPHAKPRLILTSDGGCVITWHHDRSPSGNNVYAQRLDSRGYLGRPQPSISDVQDFPNDQGGQVLVSWIASYLDSWPGRDITSYSIWARDTVGGATGQITREANEVVQFSEDHSTNEAIMSRLNIAAERLQLLISSGWTFVLELPAVQMDEYSCVAFTFGDSTAAGIPWVEYMVFAHTSDPWVFWESNPDSGYSVDNLAPGAPLNLAGDWNSPDGVFLSWEASGHHDEDLAYYTIYRGDVSGFPLNKNYFIGTSEEEVFLDPASAGTWYYRVTANDVHGNEGGGSNEAVVSVQTEVPSTLPVIFALHGNAPNPFNPTTRILFDLPEEVPVSLTVYSPNGRKVVELARGVWPAGAHTVEWNGRGADGRTMASGVYIARLEAGNFRASHRMVLVK